MSSSDSDDGFYSNANVFKNIRIAREQLRKDYESKQEGCATKNAGKVLEGSCAENQVNTVNTTENVANNTNDVMFIDSIEDDLILDEIIAKNSKPARGRGRGRGRKKAETVEAPVTPEVSNPRGRGRRGKRGRPSQNNVTVTEPSNALNTSVVLNGASNTRQNRATTSITDDNSSIIENVLNMITGRGRGRKRSRATSYSPNSNDENILDGVLSGNVNGRGRGRQRGRVQSSPRGRGRRGQWVLGRSSFRQPIIPMPPVAPSYPTYSVGNTDDYHDKSDDVPLFSKSTNTNQPTNVSDDVVILENEETENSDDNELLPVKVIWKSLNVYKFTIRKYQKLVQIFDSFAQKENVGKDKLLFMYRNKIITSDDTPASIDYNIAKFIDGGIVSQSIKIVNEKTKINGIQIKFQCQNRKKPLEITIGKDDKVMLAMRQCAESLDVPMDKLKFEFDGDMVTGTCTPQQMGLENGDCVDVTILS